MCSVVSGKGEEEGGGSGINTRPSIIMTGSRKCSPFPVTWLPAVLAAIGRKIKKMIESACVCV